MTFSERINDLFDRGEWAKARALLEGRLKEEPDNHWLLTRLGTTYYEEHDYKKALRLSEKAYKLAPECPLVLWDLASTLEMREEDAGAVSIYAKLIRLGVKFLTEERCEHEGCEGTPWLMALMADCLYSLAGCMHRLDELDKALVFIRQHLEFRAMGAKSIYPLREARARLREILGESAGSASGVFRRELEEAGKQLAQV